MTVHSQRIVSEIEAAPELELEYGIEKSKVDSIRCKLFAGLRAVYQERDRLRLLVKFSEGSTRALAWGFQRPR